MKLHRRSRDRSAAGNRDGCGAGRRSGRFAGPGPAPDRRGCSSHRPEGFRGPHRLPGGGHGRCRLHPLHAGGHHRRQRRQRGSRPGSRRRRLGLGPGRLRTLGDREPAQPVRGVRQRGVPGLPDRSGPGPVDGHEGCGGLHRHRRPREHPLGGRHGLPAGFRRPDRRDRRSSRPSTGTARWPSGTTA